MAEFTAAATLDVSVDDSQLRQVRREIEQGIGDVSVGVDGGGGGTGRGGVQDLLREQIDILEDIRDRGGAGGGDGGGGAFGAIGISGLGGGATLGRAGAAAGTAGALGAALFLGGSQLEERQNGGAFQGGSDFDPFDGPPPTWLDDLTNWADAAAPPWVNDLLGFGGGFTFQEEGGGAPLNEPGAPGRFTGDVTRFGVPDPTLPGVGGERDEDIINVGRRGMDIPPASGGGDTFSTQEEGGAAPRQGEVRINVNPRVESSGNGNQREMERIAREEGQKAAQRIIDRANQGPGPRTVDLFD